MHYNRPSEAAAGDDAGTFRYWAFISYSHADESWARWLHHALETYRIPPHLAGRTTRQGTVPGRLRPVFRDRDELAAASELGPALQAALRESSALIVLCSPQAAKSRWVNDEVLFFKRLGRSKRVFPLIVAAEGPQQLERRRCFPPAVLAALNADGTVAPMEIEPLAADAHPAQDGKPLALQKIIAAITGLPLDELRQRDQQRRNRRLAVLSTLALTLTLAMSVLALVAWQQRHAAVRSAELAQASEAKAISSEQLARAEAARAVAAESDALKEKELTRRALARSQVALAEAAFRRADLTDMVQALESVPEDLRDQRWDYLAAKRDSSLGDFRLPGIGAVAVSAALPGKRGQFAVLAPNGNLAIVDVAAGRRIVGEATGIRGGPAMTVNRDGTRIAVTHRGAAEIRILLVADLKADATVPNPATAVTRLAFSPDGTSLVVLDGGGEAPALSVVDLRDGKVRWQQPGAYDNAIFSPDGTRLYAVSQRLRRFVMLGTASGEVLVSQPVQATTLSLSRDGRRLAMGLHNGEVVLLEASTGIERRRARLHLGTVERLTWTAGDHLLTLGGEATFDSGRRVMRLWDPTNFSARGTFFGIKEGLAPGEWSFNAVSGHLLVAGNPARLWRIPADMESARLVSTTEQGTTAAFLNDTTLMARKETSLSRYDVTDPRTIREIATPPLGALTVVAPFWPGGWFALAPRTGPPPYPLKLYSGPAGALALKQDLPAGGWVTRLDFDEAGKQVLAVMHNGGAKIFAADGGAAGFVFTQKFERAVFAGGANRLVAIVPKKRTAEDVDDEVALFDTRTGDLLKRVVYQSRLNELVASPDRRLVAVGGEEQVVRVLDAETLEERWSFRAHDAEISAMAFHPREPAIATASPDGSVKLWDYESARLRETFLGIDATPVMLAFSPNGRLLVVESQEDTTRLYDLSGESAPAAVTSAGELLPPDAEGWQDVLGALNSADIIRDGNGWRLDRGVLRSPPLRNAKLPLTGAAEGLSYQLRLKVRRTAGRDLLHVMLPIGDSMAGFELDGSSQEGTYTGLARVNDKFGKSLPGAVPGPQVRSRQPHVLELNVRVGGSRAQFSSTLDGRRLFDWSGPLSALSPHGLWKARPGMLTLGTNGAGWEVSEVKLKRL